MWSRVAHKTSVQGLVKLLSQRVLCVSVQCLLAHGGCRTTSMVGTRTYRPPILESDYVSIASKPPAASTNLTLMPIRHQAKASPSALRLKRRRRRERRSKPSYTTMGTTFRSQVDGIPLVGQTLTLAWPEPGLALAWPWPGPDPSPGLAWPWPDLA
jgi:hypothetical protein